MQNSAIAKLSRGVKLYLELARLRVSMRHVKSYQQAPWNELVDVLAKIKTGILPSGGCLSQDRRLRLPR